METDTVETIVAHMREAAAGSREIGTSLSREIAGLLTSFADRLQSAHEAERAEIANLRAGNLAYATDNANLQGRAMLAESRLREAERDARRYRWLREPSKARLNNRGQPAAWIEGPGNEYIESDWLTGEQADAAIDRAMGGEDG